MVITSMASAVKIGTLFTLYFYGSCSVVPTDSIFEGRIFEDAPAGTEVTLHPEFESVLKQYRGCLLRVLHPSGDVKVKRAESSVESHSRRTADGQYFDYGTSKLTLETSLKIDRQIGEYYEVPLAAFCAGDGESMQWMVIIRVSQINRYPPTFDHRTYTFWISKKTQLGTILGSVKAQDRDAVIYNSLINYKLLNEASEQEAPKYYYVDNKSGVVRLVASLNEVPAAQFSKPLSVEACDYGSPRRCDVATIEILLVPLQSPSNITVLTDDSRYHIICWSRPTTTMEPDFYTVHIETVHSDDKIHRNTFLSKIVYPEGKNSSPQCVVISTRGLDKNLSWHNESGHTLYHIVRVATHLMDDEIVSQPVVAPGGKDFLYCDGVCLNNGTPACHLFGNETETLIPYAMQFQNGGLFYCVCPHRFDGNMCQNERFCESISLQSTYGHMSWSPTPVDSQASAHCPYGPDSILITRTCTWNVIKDKAMWSATFDVDQCRTLDEFLAATSLKSLDIQLSNASQILNVLSILEKSSDAIANDHRLADRMIDFINATIAIDFKQITDKKKMSASIKTILTAYVENVQIPSGGQAVLQSDNVVATVAKVKPGVDPVAVDVGKEAKLKIPRCVVDQASVSEPRVAAIWLKDDKIFDLSDESNSTLSQRAILIISVQGVEEEHDLIEPILFSLVSPAEAKRSDNRSRNTCVYWQEKRGAWSAKGVETIGIDASSRLVQCETSHLTGFSILLWLLTVASLSLFSNERRTLFQDFDPRSKVDLENRRKLNVLSWIGCGCSMAALLLTIITYSLFPCLHRDHAGKVLLNLCSSMFFLNAIFILSSLRPMAHYSLNACVGIGALLHYFTLSTLLWMGVEAANMYQMLVQVFASTENLFMAKRCLVAWGIPLITVIVTLSTNADHYFDSDDDYCRLNSHYAAIRYALYLGPACLILLVNCIGFAFVLKVLTQANASTCMAKPKTQAGSFVKYSTLLAQVRGALSVMVLLGITWVLGAFAIGPARLPFMYAFSALNSLQGFIIFLVRCLGYDEARRAWCMFLRKGKLKRQRGKCVVEQRYSDSRSSSNARVRKGNAGSSFDGVDKPLTVIRNGEKARKMINVHQEKNGSSFEHTDNTEVTLVPRRWRYIDEPSSPTVNH